MKKNNVMTPQAPAYEIWYGDLVYQTELLLNINTSDAQGFLMANEFYISQAWGIGMDAKQAAKHVDNKSKAEALINEAVKMVKPIVEKIEAGIETTKNHYGAYMAVLGQVGPDKNVREKLAACLIKAGANKQGVTDALRLTF